MAKRTDIHREGAVIPSDYTYLTSYALPSTIGGWPCPAINLDVVAKLHKEHPRAEYGGVGKCTICGANYSYGDVWQHNETKELIHVGHDCADKVGWIADRSEYDGMRMLLVEQIKKERKLFKLCNEDKALFAAMLSGKHPVLVDMKARLLKYKSLSDKQIAFALRLHAEELAPVAKGEAKTVEKWLPVVGDTYPIKEKIKALNTSEATYARWDSVSKVWLVKESKHAEVMAMLKKNEPTVALNEATPLPF